MSNLEPEEEEEEDLSPLEAMVKEREQKLVKRLAAMNTNVERIETEIAKRRLQAKKQLEEEEESVPNLEHVGRAHEEQLTKNITTMDANLQRLETTLAKKRLQAKAINEDIELFESGNKRSFLYLERARAGRMSLLWLITVCVTLFCTFGTFSTKAYGLSVANFFAFLLVWRSLYVQSSSRTIIVAVAIVGITIYFF